MTAKSDPGKTFVSVTASDVTVYNPPLRALYVGTGGTVVVKDPAGGTGTFVNFPDGGEIYAEISQVMSTGATASDYQGYR